MRVLYITGYVRSGSTLLSLLLGELAQCFSLGEMSAMVYGPGTSLSDWCMCGRNLRECEFWSAVWEAAFPGSGQRERANLCHQLGREARIRSRYLLGGSQSGGLGGREGEKSRSGMRRLYEAAARRSQARVLVDSSKTPAHAFMLGSSGISDLVPVHLVRHPCAVVFSQARTKKRMDRSSGGDFLPQRSLLRAVSGWVKANLLAERLTGAGRRGVRVSYEDLVERPLHVLESLEHLMDRSWRGYAIERRGSVSETKLQSRHDVAGNPARANWDPRIDTFRPDLEWRSAMAVHQRWLVTLLTLPLMRRYGYLSTTTT